MLEWVHGMDRVSKWGQSHIRAGQTGMRGVKSGESI